MATAVSQHVSHELVMLEWITKNCFEPLQVNFLVIKVNKYFVECTHSNGNV